MHVFVGVRAHDRIRVCEGVSGLAYVSIYIYVYMCGFESNILSTYRMEILKLLSRSETNSSKCSQVAK